MSRSLANVRLAVLMLDGLELKGRCCVVCLGVMTDGVKVPLGLWDGSLENATICSQTSRIGAWGPEVPRGPAGPWGEERHVWRGR